MFATKNYNLSIFQGSGTMIDENSYINSPSASTVSTVVGRPNSRNRAVIPPKLPIATPPPQQFTPGGAIAYMTPQVSHPAIGAYGGTGAEYSLPRQMSMPVSQPSANNSTACSASSAASNVFSYEHIPDNRIRPHGKCMTVYLSVSISFASLRRPRPLSFCCMQGDLCLKTSR